MVIGDLSYESFNILPIQSIMNRYNVNINILEYHSLCLKINDFMNFLEKSVNEDILPRNSPVNHRINLDFIGVSILYLR